MILVVDNRDSFLFNLVQGLSVLGAELEVVRADRISVDEIVERAPERILIGPGPGRPEAARTSVELFRSELPVPVLGICLGHQALAIAFGGRVQRSTHLIHGRTVRISHDGRGVFRGLAAFPALARYNSLTVDPLELPAELEISARAQDASGDVMGLRHRELPYEGVQFHPESILSAGGELVLANFLDLGNAVHTESSP